MDTALNYNYKVVKQFAVATVVWGVVGMLVGVIIAAQLAWPALNFDTAWLTYGRPRDGARCDEKIWHHMGDCNNRNRRTR